jgi:hypothetical protein
LLLAALWCIGLVVAAAMLPFYRSETATALGTADGATSRSATTGTGTLLEVNGAGVLVVVSMPLVAVVLVWAALLLRRRRHRYGAGPLAWTIVGLLGALAFVGMLTIGIFILPVVVLLAIACAAAPQTPRPIGGIADTRSLPFTS